MLIPRICDTRLFRGRAVVAYPVPMRGAEVIGALSGLPEAAGSQGVVAPFGTIPASEWLRSGLSWPHFSPIPAPLTGQGYE